MKMNDLQLVTGPQGVLMWECDCFTINYFDVAQLKAEKVKTEKGSYDNFARGDSHKEIILY